MIVKHRGHIIEIFAREIPNSHNWAVTILVSWESEGESTIHEFHGPVKGFPRREDGETWGAAFAINGLMMGNQILPPLLTSEVHISGKDYAAMNKDHKSIS